MPPRKRELIIADEAESPSVVVFDPGGTTGWCVMMVHPESLQDPEVPILDNILHFEYGQIEGMTEAEQGIAAAELCEVWDSSAVVVEDFQLRTLVAELSPVSIKGMIEFHLLRDYEQPRTAFLQMSSCMTTATDDRLKRWGLYRPGQPHARDAVRHAIYFLRQAKAKPAIRARAWPDIYQYVDRAA